MGNLPIPRPFLKWAGGKARLAAALLERRPKVIKTYHEPFVGSGAVFFHLYREGHRQGAILSDVNPELIDTYLAIRDQVGDVMQILSEFQYHKDFYYEVRAKDPWTLERPERAARMIYLNKTGYNGLYRVNQSGKFNVPFGRYKAPKYFDKENLLAVSAALQNADIICASFETVASRAKSGDWVYFDPPYVPISQTSNFTSYYADGFDLASQKKLRDICVELCKENVSVTISNSDTQAVRSLYSIPGFVIDEIQAHRAINCNHVKRGKITELIISNYQTGGVTQLGLFEPQRRQMVIHESV